MIACRTIIGFGMPNRQGTQKAHSDAPGEEEIAAARKELNWPYEPFVIPDDILSAWRAIGARGAERLGGMDQRARSASDKAARLRRRDGRRHAGIAGQRRSPPTRRR